MFGFLRKKKTKKYPTEYTTEFEMDGRRLILWQTPDSVFKDVYDQLDADQRLYLAMLYDRHFDCPDTLEDHIAMALIWYWKTRKRVPNSKFIRVDVNLTLYSRQLEQNYSKAVESDTLGLDLEHYATEVARPVAKAMAFALARDWKSTDVKKATIKITQC